MEVSTIKQRCLAICDDEITNKIKEHNIEYAHFYRIKDSGGISIIAKPPPPDELTLGKNYKKVATTLKGVSFRTPKYLLPHVGKKFWFYTERLCPEENEIFRIKPIDFSLKDDGKLANYKQHPYFTSGNNFIAPHHYLNENITHKIRKLKVSFNKCSSKVLDGGFLFIFIIDYDSDGAGLGGGLYTMEKRLTNMRTMPTKRFLGFLKRHNKNIQNYKYFRTVPSDGCPYGLIVFKEVG